MKLLVLFACLISAGLAAGVKRDLEGDVAAATTAVRNLETELIAFTSRLNSFQSELDLDVYNTAVDIVGALTELAAPNVDDVTDQLKGAYNQTSDSIASLLLNLEETSQLLIDINLDLQANRTELATLIPVLEANIAAADSLSAALSADLQAATNNIEDAILSGLTGLEGPNVTRAWVGWTHVKDVLFNQRTLTENIKFVYDARAATAVEALKVVAQQV